MPDPSSAAARRRAVAIAGHTGDIAVATTGIDDPDTAVRVAALRSLARLDRLTSAHLTHAFLDADHVVRIAAIELAATRDSPSVVDLLADDHPAVVEAAAWACGERPDAGEIEVSRLSDLVRSHDDPLVRESAVAAVGAIGLDSGLPAILAATSDKPAVRRRAVVALAAFEGPEVDAAWERARTDRDRKVRDAVDELLGPLPDS